MKKLRVNLVKVQSREFGWALIPAHPSDAEKMKTIPKYTIERYRTDSSRNLEQHNLLWALARFVVDNDPRGQFKKAEHFVAYVKMETGHCIPLRLRNGDYYKVPDSIAFEAMPQSEFIPFFEAFKEIAADYIKMPIQDIIKNLKSYY